MIFLFFKKKPRTHNQERTVSPVNGVGKLAVHMEDTKLGCYLTLCTGNNSRYIKDFGIRLKTMQLPRRNGESCIQHRSGSDSKEDTQNPTRSGKIVHSGGQQGMVMKSQGDLAPHLLGWLSAKGKRQVSAKLWRRGRLNMHL